MMLVEGVLRELWKDICSWLSWWGAGLKTPTPDSRLLAAWLLMPAAKANLSNQLSCVWVSRLELNILSLGLILCSREVIVPQSIPNWNVSNPEEMWMCMVSNLLPAPITHGGREAQPLASLATQDRFALSTLHGPFSSSRLLSDLGYAYSSRVKGNYLKTWRVEVGLASL